MQILNPKAELIWQNDIKEHVCKCARVCYGKESSNDEKLYNSLLKAGHYSMFRHASYYAVVKNFTRYAADTLLQPFENCPYIDWNHDSMNQILYIATNGNFMLDYKGNPVCEMILRNIVLPAEFMNASDYAKHLMRFTFKITTQISTSRELNRTSPNNIAEKSTRYVDLKNGEIVKPHWMNAGTAEAWNIDDIDAIDDTAWKYLNSCSHSFKMYRDLINAGMKRQDARGVLPLDTATEVVYTYSINEWKHIISLRGDKSAHPNCRLTANMIKDKLIELGYEF